MIPTTRLAATAAALLLLACAVQAGDPPYPPSSHITGVTFDFATHQEYAPGSDNWPITWSDDGHQYTSWGDGGGFGGTNTKGRVSLGVARVEGNATTYQGFNVWGGFEPENPAQFEGKSYGIISIGGILYMWWGPGSGPATFTETRLAVSTDKSATWTRSSWDLNDTDSQLIIPTILNFGQDYAGARDSWVYHYFPRGYTNDLVIQTGGSPSTGKIDLARSPSDDVMNVNAFEFFTGLDGQGNPTWSSDASQRTPVFEDANGVGWCVSVSYNAPLGRYLLMTEHDVSGEGFLGIFDAPEPWGPWTTVAYLGNPPFGDGFVDASTFYWNFSNKWLSADGEDFTILFTGFGDNDSWNSVRGTFTVAEDPMIFADGFESGDLSAWSNVLP